MFQAQRGPQRRSISISSSFCAGKSSDPSQGDDWPQMMQGWGQTSVSLALPHLESFPWRFGLGSHTRGCRAGLPEDLEHVFHSSALKIFLVKVRRAGGLLSIFCRIQDKGRGRCKRNKAGLGEPGDSPELSPPILPRLLGFGLL